MRPRWPRVKDYLHCPVCKQTQRMTGLKGDPENIYRCPVCGTKVVKGGKHGT